MLYAVFTTPSNSIPGSAVCKFSVRDLTESFHHGGFKFQVRKIKFYFFLQCCYFADVLLHFLGVCELQLAAYVFESGALP